MSKRRNLFGVVEAVLASAVNDDGTFTIAYPSGTSQLTFNAGLAGPNHRLILNDNDGYNAADPGFSLSFGGSNITVTNLTGATIPAGTKVMLQVDMRDGAGRIPLSLPVSLDTVVDGDVVTEIRPGIEGYIEHISWVTDVAPSAGDAATFNLEIDTTNVTGGTIELTSAAAGSKGTVVAGTAITANNRLTRESKLSVEASSVTDFASGSGSLIVYIRPDFDDAY